MSALPSERMLLKVSTKNLYPYVLSSINVNVRDLICCLLCHSYTHLAEIAFKFCPFGPSSFAGIDYKEQCREVATSVCEGAGEYLFFILTQVIIEIGVRH